MVVKKGSTVPFDGVLYSNAAHALLVARTQTQTERLKLTCDLRFGKLEISSTSALKLKQIELDTEKKSHALTKKLHKQQRDLLLTELKRVKKTPWYRTPVFMFTAGVVVTVGLGALAVWSVTELRK